MDVFSYEIYDGDYGIIFANDIIQASELYDKKYPDYPLNDENRSEGYGWIDYLGTIPSLKNKCFIRRFNV